MDDGVGAAYGGRGSRANVVVDTGDDDFGAAYYCGAGNDFCGAYYYYYYGAAGGGAGAGAGPGGPGRH